MNERILNLLSMCLKAKEKGHDVFFQLNPHVSGISIQSHLNGWKNECDQEGHPVYDFADKRFSFYYDYEDERFTEAEAYLKGLIEA